MLPYSDGDGDYDKRQKRLQHFLGENSFKCQCPLCIAEREDGQAARQKRQRVTESLPKISTLDRSNPSRSLPPYLRQVETAIKNIESTYKSSQYTSVEGLKYHLAPLYVRQAEVLVFMGYDAGILDASTLSIFEKAIQGAMKGLSLLCTKFPDSYTTKSAKKANWKDPATLPMLVPPSYNSALAILGALHIVSAYRGLGKLAMAKAWMNATCYICNMVHGGGKEYFLLSLKEVIDNLGLRDMAANL
jgi:hypothetical protein